MNATRLGGMRACLLAHRRRCTLALAMTHHPDLVRFPLVALSAQVSSTQYGTLPWETLVQSVAGPDACSYPGWFKRKGEEVGAPLCCMTQSQHHATHLTW